MQQKNFRITPVVAGALFAAILAACSPGAIDTHQPGADTPSADLVEGNAVATVGDVLVIGGGTVARAPTKAVEIFNPATRTFALTGAMRSPRVAIQAVSFAAGPLAHQALVTGGMSGAAKLSAYALKLGTATLATSELFQNSKSIFAASGSMVTPRYFYTATLLKNGKVLITGGYDGFTPVKTAELYNPQTRRFTATGNMLQARAMHAAALLADGTVLIAGGVIDKRGTTTQSAEIYDPATGTFSATTGAMPSSAGSAGMTATLIINCGCTNNGKVLLAGGFYGGSFSIPSSTSTLTLYNPATKTFAAAARALRDDRMFHTATDLGAGNILIAGGLEGQILINSNSLSAAYGGSRNSAEIFDPKTGITTCVGKAGAHCTATMTAKRGGHAAVLMTRGALKGDVLLTGGIGSNGTTKGFNVLNSAEIFNAKTKSFAATGAMKSTHAFHASVLVQ